MAPGSSRAMVPAAEPGTPLEDLAHELAAQHEASSRPGKRRGFDPRILEVTRRLRAIYSQLSDPDRISSHEPQAAEWLLDNEYLVYGALDSTRRVLTRGFYRRLPKLDAPRSRDTPRIQEVARAVAERAGRPLDLEEARRFLIAYQAVRPLTIAELWAFPAVLQLVMLDALGEASGRVSDEHLSRDRTPGGGERGRADPPPGWVSVANCIDGLRLIGAHDWREFFERVSLVESILRSDPVGIYRRMDFESRDRYRKVVEAIAWWSGQEEVSVARSAIERCREPSDSPGERAAHVGFHLVDAGRDALERRFDCRPPRRIRWRRRIERWAHAVYFAALAAVAGVVIVGADLFVARDGGSLAVRLFVLSMVWVPALTIAGSLVNWLVSQLAPPRLLPKLQIRDRVPPELATVVAVPCLIGSDADVDELTGRLEILQESCLLAGLRFVLLSDFTDAPAERMPGDAALLERLTRRVEELNGRHGLNGSRPFALLHRRRLWNAGEGCWMAWERKRGKLHEFNRFLIGHDMTAFAVRAGCADELPGARFVITLDADTALPRGTVERLIGALAHPLNRPVLDESDRLVAGHTVLQPRLETLPTADRPTPFATLGRSASGLDLYTHAVSDVYQDLFGEGIYAGKGIYDVAAFEATLRERVPENALLSHDLFEGVHGRVGLVSDTILLEEFPEQALAYWSRMHRWIRGDWQLLPWLFPRVPFAGHAREPNRLRALGRWKILDNLRRSLLAPSLLILLVGGWLFGIGEPVAYVVAAAVVLGFPAFLGAASAARRAVHQARAERREAGRRRPTRRSLLGIAANAGRWLLALVFLPFEALVAADAVLRTLVRLLWTRQHLLQWTSAAVTARTLRADSGPSLYWRRMMGASALAVAITVVLLIEGKATPTSLGLLAAWFLSPQIAFWVSRPPPPIQETLTRSNERWLREVALSTWLYFERYVTAENHWLPPDNLQHDRELALARRTSPTNIGMMLMSLVAAYDLGYLGPLALEALARNTMESIARLERYRGHLLNWYGTADLRPLDPRYVSSVDSGNLAASLLVLGQALRDAAETPAVRAVDGGGLADVTASLDRLVSEVPVQDRAVRSELRRVLRRCADRAGSMKGDPHLHRLLLADLDERLLPEVDRLSVLLVEDPNATASRIHELRQWSAQLHRHVATLRGDIDRWLPWLALLDDAPRPCIDACPDSEVGEAYSALLDVLGRWHASGGAPPWPEHAFQAIRDLEMALGATIPAFEARREALEWCQSFVGHIERGVESRKRFGVRAGQLAAQCDRLFEEMDFGVLFDRSRQLLHIGYRVTDQDLDPHYYDLLASEARLASYMAIAKGDVPVSHWLHLGRAFTLIGRSPALLSWGATMFEYLLPTLFLRTPANSLLGGSCRRAVLLQIAFGRRNRLPWGISESAYGLRDAEDSYQYRAFGVPGLGLRSGLGDRWVVAPYASALALRYEPRAAVSNLSKLERLGARGRWGFYEAIDYGSPGADGGKRPALVRAFMAHHQGMILAAIDNFLNRDILVARIHADPRIAAVEYLLHERMPWRVPVRRAWTARDRAVPPPPAAPRRATPWIPPETASIPQVHILSNRSHRVLVSADGAGYSAWRDLSLTRWRRDPTLDRHGNWIYFVDLDSGDAWSVTPRPVGSPAEAESVRFWPHMAEFRGGAHRTEIRLRITVPPDDDVEIRYLTLTNTSDRPRDLGIVTYSEVILASASDDLRHPAYGELFLEGEYLAEEHAILYRRRPRSHEQRAIFFAHRVVHDGTCVPSGWELDRGRFLGRNGTPRAPAALRQGRIDLSGGVGAPLHPVAVLGTRLQLPPYATRQIAFVTAAGVERNAVLASIREYGSLPACAWGLERAHRASEAEMRDLGLSSRDLEEFQQLLSAALYPCHELRARPEHHREHAAAQSALWRFGISGDHPILLFLIHDPGDMRVARQLLRAHAYWSSRGQRVDLVLFDISSGGYAQPLRDDLRTAIGQIGEGDRLEGASGVHLLSAEQAGQEGRRVLEAAASVLVDARRGSLTEQLAGLREAPPEMPAFVPLPTGRVRDEATPPLERPRNLQFDNGYGGFSVNGREYVIYLEPGRTTPAPWCNLLAQPEFGCLITESGGGFTWAVDAGENRLTPWRNDPVSDEISEALYMRDEETAAVWSPTPRPVAAPAPYEIRHGAGYTVFRHRSHGLEHRLRVFCGTTAPVKLSHLRLRNLWSRPRRITVTYYAEWALGADRALSIPHIVPDYQSDARAILARNPFSVHFGDRSAFLTGSEDPHGLTTDRTEFLGRGGEYARPDALYRIGLSGRVEPGTDSCAAYQIHLDFKPGEAKEIHFALGQGRTAEEAVTLARRYRRPHVVAAEWDLIRRFWDERLDRVRVRTPDSALNVVLNRWLLYQVLSSRLWGRTGYYQSGGAFGYRDQLQDVLAWLDVDPGLAREHILEAAGHQFVEGDVLHWWHPVTDAGVRTRCSDDLVWLPYATAAYVRRTGDMAILSEPRPFLLGPPLGPEEVDRYGKFESTHLAEPLYEHCLRALERASEVGAHGLPLIGKGDWNDGLDRVGSAGKGESVWLAWFLIATLRSFAPLCEGRGDLEEADRLRRRARTLAERVEGSGWDGEWYRRAYYDDGSPLGSSQNREARIDAISQAWAVMSNAGSAERQRRAMESVDRLLVRRTERLVLLLDPPFDRSLRDPGYIKGYPPGIRENGGQYSHGAAWVGWAYAALGDAERAVEVLRMLNPVLRSTTEEEARLYRVEPYAVAADVYGHAPHTGRGGWTWYTGSAAWLYRLGMEGILGLRREAGQLYVEPRIPDSWNGYEVWIRTDRGPRHIRVERTGTGRGYEVWVNDRRATRPRIA